MAQQVVAITEQQGGKWHRMSWEALAAAQQIASELSRPVEAVVLGHDMERLAAEVAAKGVARVWSLDDPLLVPYTPDAFCLALEQFVAAQQPYLIVLPHTYQVRDFAPRLAAQLGSSLLSDCIGCRMEGGELIFTRQLFQGRMNADLSFEGPPPYFVSVQAGGFSADDVKKGDAPAPVERFAVRLEASQIRTHAQEPFQEAKRTVDLAQAEIIIAAGRGIKEQEHLALIQKLADALGGEVGGSRPICDNGWLPMERQIGSSGQTVAPKLYIGVGISGAIQHLVGMKGSRTVVAINKDPHAPIFEVADYGIVGNLFDVVPALIDEIGKARSG